MFCIYGVISAFFFLFDKKQNNCERDNRFCIYVPLGVMFSNNDLEINIMLLIPFAKTCINVV